ncbi:hypothetical protein HDU85_007742 [Gaertneriomyces sp. JEL0708]|nr:hypothetical protein HDU85_007742 [Gaertneriomyces sp. JEL0708]
MQTLGLINDRTPDTNTTLIVHSLLSALLRACPASLHRLSSSWLKRLKQSILLSRPLSETVAHKKFDVAQSCVCVSAGILQRLLDSRELALEELENFGTDFVQEVITMIDIPKSDDDPTTSDLLLLLATLHTHHSLKPSNPPLIPPILASLVISHSLQSLPQVLIFNFNRAADRAERLHYCMLLNTILHDPSLTDFFYTNDLGVLSDIAVRETGNVDSEDEQVHHAYIQLLPAIVKHPMAHSAISSHRAQNVEHTLRDICSGAFVKASTRKCAEKALAECRGERVRTPP